nr:DNA helicase [Tanacetum cinerariifolium]
MCIIKKRRTRLDVGRKDDKEEAATKVFDTMIRNTSPKVGETIPTPAASGSLKSKNKHKKLTKIALIFWNDPLQALTINVDTKSARSIILGELKKLIKTAPLFCDKIQTRNEKLHDKERHTKTKILMLCSGARVKPKSRGATAWKRHIGCMNINTEAWPFVHRQKIREALTGGFVLPFGGVSDSEEMLNLLGVPFVNCPTHNTQLYLNVFQKCSEFCGGNLRRERTTTFRVVCRTEDAKLYLNVYQKYRQGCKEVSWEGPNTISNGTPSAADVMRVDYESQKLKSSDAADIFQAYSALCSRGIGGRRLRNPFMCDGRSLTFLTVSFFSNAHNTGPSTSRGGRNTRANPKVSLTTAEATCSSGISRRRLVRHRPSTRGPTVGSSSASGAEIKRFMTQYPELTAFDRADVVALYSRVSDAGIDTLPHFALGRFKKYNKSAEDVDQYISAELPNLRVDPDGYNIVFETMMHGPCGAANLNTSCMKGDKSMGESSTEVSPSREMMDEILNHVDVRFICAHEAYWRILKFDIHHREPAVQILAVHLQDMQRITFRDRDRLRSVIDLPGKKNTTLTEWFAYSANNETGRHLSYLEFSLEFVWHSDSKSWSPRRNIKSSIGRLAYVHPTLGELFFLRLLLCHRNGCRDFLEVQTIYDVFYPTYRATCEALGLLGDDREWETTLEEACVSATSEQLRFVFSHILIHCDVADPSKLWTKY